MIELKNVHKSYSNTDVLKGIDLKLNKGAIHTLIGANGSGKSTMLNIIAGLLEFDKGIVSLEGSSLSGNRAEIQGNIGYVLEQQLLIERFSVSDFLGFIGLLQNIDRITCRERIDDLCRFLELKKDKPIEDLSRGQKLKTSIAASLIHKPAYLVWDEPFNGLDFSAARKISQLLKKLSKNGVTILVTSHQYDIILEISDEVFVLDQGVVRQNLKKDQLLEKFGAHNEYQKRFKNEMIEAMGGEVEADIPTWLLK